MLLQRKHRPRKVQQRRRWQASHAAAETNARRTAAHCTAPAARASTLIAAAKIMLLASALLERRRGDSKLQRRQRSNGAQSGSGPALIGLTKATSGGEVRAHRSIYNDDAPAAEWRGVRGHSAAVAAGGDPLTAHRVCGDRPRSTHTTPMRATSTTLLAVWVHRAKCTVLPVDRWRGEVWCSPGGGEYRGWRGAACVPRRCSHTN